MQNTKNKVEHNKNNNRFNLLADNSVIEEKNEDEVETNNDVFKIKKGQGIKTNDKDIKITKKHKKKEEHGTKDVTKNKYERWGMHTVKRDAKEIIE